MRRRRDGFTLVEVLVTAGVIAVLAGLVLPSLAGALGRSRRTVCMNNLRQLSLADVMYANEFREFPAPHPFVPSSITVERLAGVAAQLGTTVPAGAAGEWPRRSLQPRWVNCPLATESGMAEGVALGGGLYTGYAYFGGMEDSAMIANGLATAVNPGQAADRRNTRRGVLWTDVLDEFAMEDPRRFEFFHRRLREKYRDFRFFGEQLDGIHRAWSDGSVEWTAGGRLLLSGPGSPDCRLVHLLGNYYF